MNPTLVHIVALLAASNTAIVHGFSAGPATLSSRSVNQVNEERQALIEKCNELNPASHQQSKSWSNRPGKVLTPISDTVYSADRPFIWNDIDVGGRMAVIQLPNDDDDKNGQPDLWVHSPVGLDDELRQALAKLGTVKYVVSPNYEHLKYAAQWHEEYPEAQMWACPGLMERMPHIQWTGEFPFGLRPVSWKGTTSSSERIQDEKCVPWDSNTLQALHIDVEKNPFTGTPFFNEVIFYHAPSKTLIATDLFWNYPASAVPNSEFDRDDTWELAPLHEIPLGTTLWKFGMDKVYAPFFNKLMVTDKTAYRRLCEHVAVDGWDVETVVPCHGDIMRGKAFVQQALKRFFRM